MKWKLGVPSRTIISETAIADVIQSTESIRYYGGHLIAESIPTEEIAHIIKAAPELLEAAKVCEKGLSTSRGSIPFMVDMLRSAIASAEGRLP